MVRIGPLLTKLWFPQVGNPKWSQTGWLSLVVKTGTKNDVYFLVYVHINHFFCPIYTHKEKRTTLLPHYLTYDIIFQMYNPMVSNICVMGKQAMYPSVV